MQLDIEPTKQSSFPVCIYADLISELKWEGCHYLQNPEKWKYHTGTMNNGVLGGLCN